MNVAGIIAEYDPLHTGHEWQIQQAKQMGAKAVVCVVSPSVVQRGGLSILPAHTRVKAALLAGADLVIQLPAPYAASSAEQFGAAAVFLLNSLGSVDSLVFGSESGDAAPLMQTAQVLQSEEFIQALKQELNKGDSFALARIRAMEKICPQALPFLEKPNDILGIEYCKAILSQKSTIKPVAIQRQGAGHEGAPSGGFASASWLRLQTAKDGVSGWAEYTPQCCEKLYQKAEQQGLLLNRTAMDFAILSRLRQMEKEEILQIRGVGEGLENRLLSGLKTAASLEELYINMKCKRYPHARLRRLVLDTALKVPQSLPPFPPYLHFVGASQLGLQLLKQSTPSLPAGSSLAKLEHSNPQTALVAKLHNNAENLSALCRQSVQPMGTAYTNGFVIREKLIATMEES